MEELTEFGRGVELCFLIYRSFELEFTQARIVSLKAEDQGGKVKVKGVEGAVFSLSLSTSPPISPLSSSLFLSSSPPLLLPLSQPPNPKRRQQPHPPDCQSRCHPSADSCCIV